MPFDDRVVCDQTECTDLVLPGLEKVIILRYHIPYKSVSTVMVRFSEELRALVKQWCFGRRVSFSAMVDYGSADERGDSGSDFVFEFVNLNTFLSVDALREWFERIIFEYGLFTKEPLENLMRFEFGSYHFIDSPKEREQSPSPFAVTVSFCNLAMKRMNPQSVINPKINGIAITMDSVKCNMTSSDGQRFIDYSEPKLFRYFVATKSLHQHYGQRADKRQQSTMAMDQIVNQRPNPPEYKCSDTAPPMTLNQNQNSMTFQNENKGPSPLELDCSLNAPSNVHSPMKDIQNTESIQQHSVYPLPQNNIDALPLVFRQFTESDYDYSDSEENAAMDFQRNEPMERNEQNVDNTELRLLMAKYEKFGIVIERGHSL